MNAHVESPMFTDIFADEGDAQDDREDVLDARHVTIAGHRYTRRRQDTNRVQRAREQVHAIPSVIREREWVAVWIELVDASLYTPPRTPRAGRILREAYADASIRLPAIRDLGLSLLPPAAKPVPRAVAAPDDVRESVPV